MKHEKIFLAAAALLVLGIVIAPDVIIQAGLGKEFYPYHFFEVPIKTMDFTFYSSIISKVTNTGWVFETQIYESASNTLSREWLPFLIGGLLAGLFGNAWPIIIKSLGTAAIFIIVWLLLGRWIEDKKSRLTATVAFTLFPAIFGIVSISPMVFFDNIFRFIGAASLFIDRFHSPIATLPFFLIAIYFTLKTFDNPTKKNAVIAGLFAGLLFYTYFFYIAFFSGLLIVIAIRVFENSKKKKIMDSVPKEFVIIFLTVLVVASPYFLVMLSNFLTGISKDMVLRFGLEEVSRPYYYLPTIKYLLLLAVTVFVSKKISNERALFAGIIFSGVLAMNFQVFSGINLQFIHWQHQIVDPIAFLLVVSLFSSWKKNELKIKKIEFGSLESIFKKTCIPITIAFLLLGAFVQVNALEKYCGEEFAIGNEKCLDYTIEPDERQALEWLGENSSKEDVVLALSAETNARLSADLGLFVYYPNGFLSTASNEEIENRLGFAYKFFDVPKETFEYILTPEKDTLEIHLISEEINSAEDRVKAEKALIANYPFHFLYHSTDLWQNKKFNKALEGWPEEVQNEIREEGYEGNNFFYPKNVADRLLGIYDESNPSDPSGKLNWVWVGEYEKEIGNLSENSNLEKVFENEKVTIYRFIK